MADASATLPWCFDDESTSWSEELFSRLEDGDILHVPAHWVAEVTNALRMAERRGRLASGSAEAFLEQLAGFALRVDTAPTPPEAKNLLHLSRKHGLTIYDAIYLELALRLGMSFATLDGELITAALSEGVTLL